MTKYLSSSYQQEFAYLPYIVIYMLILFLALSCLMGALFNFKKPFTKKFEKNRNKYEKLGHEGCCELLCLYCYGMFCCCCGCWKKLFRCCCCGLEIGRPLVYFEIVYDSHCYILGMLFMLAFRTAVFVAMIYYDIYLVILNDSNAKYRFGNWVNFLITIYFISTAMLSTWGLKTRLFCWSHGDERIKWPALWERFAVVALLLYEICFVNSLFVMIVQLVYFSDSTSFDNLKRHVAPFVGMCIDYFFNIMPLRMEHYGYTLLLPILYLIFQWVTVYMGELNWQYAFLYVSSPRSFMRYSILVGVHWICHVVLSLSHTLRDRVVCGMKYDDRHRFDEAEGEIDVENMFGRNENDSREEIRREVEMDYDHADSYPRPVSTEFYDQKALNNRQKQQFEAHQRELQHLGLDDEQFSRL